MTDQIGTITELMTEDSYINYRQKLNLWGEAEIDGYRHYTANDSTPLSCNHRFVGQYYDEESGLHYNRFRYYSPETGQYISHDPIGLLGGFNPYGYVGIPTGWVDPLGLAGCNKNFGSRKEAFRAAKQDAGIPRSQQPDMVRDPSQGNKLRQYRKVPMTDRNNHVILDGNGKPIMTREYQFTRSDGSKVIIQDHSAGHQYTGDIGSQGSHFNVRPPENVRTGKVIGTKEHYSY
ncbi:HNH/endonuclease VII fold putative polymorphic toxin [Pasteurellaceae bacterium LIM206]|nr:HNH/endonuclease VII fold putative polymorphic toxin [Pasteurellaceae bacterium LIM206]